MNIIIYISTLVVLGAIDSIWLFLMGAHYKVWLASVFAPSFNFVPAVLFYVLYAFGLMFFVILPALRSGFPLVKVLLMGAFLGLIAFGTYNLTNHATLRDWPLVVTIVDMAWGATLSGVASVIVVSIFRYFK